MFEYKKFRVKSLHNETSFEVWVKGWFCWRDGYLATNYFSIDYPSKQAALDAIECYKNRITEV